MHRRTFTLAQANALVPWLGEVFTANRRDVAELSAIRGRAGRRRVDSSGNVEDADLARQRALEDGIRGRLEEVVALGIEVRRVDGLVDFPGWRDGQLVYLCWQFGEEEITFYHPTSEGFTGRRPLEQVAPELN
jgi:hypothetical protein